MDREKHHLLSMQQSSLVVTHVNANTAYSPSKQKLDNNRQINDSREPKSNTRDQIHVDHDSRESNSKMSHRIQFANGWSLHEALSLSSCELHGVMCRAPEKVAAVSWDGTLFFQSQGHQYLVQSVLLHDLALTTACFRFSIIRAIFSQ